LGKEEVDATRCRRVKLASEQCSKSADPPQVQSISADYAISAVMPDWAVRASLPSFYETKPN